MEKILIRAPVSLKEAVKGIAKQQGLTINALILQILWEWAKDNDVA